MIDLLHNTWAWWQRQAFLNHLMKSGPWNLFTRRCHSPPLSPLSPTSYPVLLFPHGSQLSRKKSVVWFCHRILRAFNKPLPKAELTLKGFWLRSVWHWQLRCCFFNTMLLVHMVGINPWDMDQGGSLHHGSLPAAHSWIMEFRHKYANLGISLVMPLYCKLQWLIYYVWTKDWSEEVLWQPASWPSLSCSFSHHDRIWIAGDVAPKR